MKQADIDARRAMPVPAAGLFIDGAGRAAADGATLDVLSPLDGSLLTTIADATAQDLDAACHSARFAFERGGWSRRSPVERKKVLLKLADLIEARALDLAVLGVRDNGTEITMALKAEPLSAAATFRYYGELIDKVYGEIAPTDWSVLGLVH
ncbi:MAG: aldehyde dehydrogenase family protein, partial [Mesorhizobium sp.]